MEADELILADLRNIGCQIPDDIKALKELGANLFVTCVLRCLRLIDKERDYPRQLATARAQKVNQATQIVKALQELGYSEDLSYHNLLYPNDLDSRRVLGWLVPRVPVKETNLNEASSLITQRIEEEFMFLATPKALWTPYTMQAFYDKEKGQRFYGLTAFSSRNVYSPASSVYYPNNRRILPEQKQYFADTLPLLTAQPSQRDAVIPSVLEYNTRQFTEAQERDNEWNTVGITSGLNPIQYNKEKEKKTLATMAEHLRNALAGAKKKGGSDIDDFIKNFAPKLDDNQLGRATKFGKEQVEEKHEETEEERRLRREQEREQAEKELASLEGKVQQVEQEIQVSGTEILQLTAQLQKETDRTEQLKKEYLELKTTMDLVENAEENMKKLKEFSDKHKERLLKFAEDWEKVRQPMIEEYRTAKENYTKREEEIKMKLEQIKAMRSEMKQLQSGLAEKDERYRQLLDILKTMPKTENRNSYTTKILALVNGVKKQRVEISKILLDTKNVQKEINTITDTLNRTFAVVEEMIFADVNKDNKKDPNAAEAYKLVARLNKIFTELTDDISKAGNASNAGLNLEEKIEKLEQRSTALNSDKIAEDLKQVKEENAKLLAQYQAQKAEKGGEKKEKKK